MRRQFTTTQSMFMRGASVACFLLLVQLGGLGERLGFSEYDVLSVLTAVPPPSQGVVIIGIDDPSFLELDLSPPLPRRLYAQLIEAVVEADAKSLGIDLLFSEPQRQDDDLRMEQALFAADKQGIAVVLAGARVEVTSTQVQSYTQHLLPIYADVPVGYVNHLADVDRVVRRISTDTHSFWHQVTELSGVEYWPPPPGARLRYYAPEVDLDYVQFTQALFPDKNLPPNAFRDRLLLLGVNTPVSGVDRFPTPFGDHEIAGVALHATAINNALFNDWIATQPLWVTLVSTALVLLALMIATRQWKPGHAAWVLLCSLVLLCAGVIWQFYLGWWWLLWPSVLGAIFLYNYDAATNYWVEWRRKEQLRELFSSYVPSAIVDQLTQQHMAPVTSGEKRELTILFADLAGFTAANEVMSPDEVATALNEYFSVMTQVIHGQGGTLDKFIGDAVMAFWNAPLDQPDHANRALASACDMQRAMDELRKHWYGTPFENIKLRVGLHTGEASVGNMGSKARFTYTAVGDSVNTAARLEGANKVMGSDILLSKSTVEQLRGDNLPPLAWLDRLRVAGKHDAIDVFTPVQDPLLAETSRAVLDYLIRGELDPALKACQFLCILMEQQQSALLPQTERIFARLQGLQGSINTGRGASRQTIDFSLSIGK
ncbi:MAG: CHASE2 domain-containing protein [Nitrincola lacisaponensis]|uniref:CHASE2 domain-containing protein n=1 Tax=Nitrincola lacisaponensis TaxID=267850 RepID=UPI00391A4E6E